MDRLRRHAGRAAAAAAIFAATGPVAGAHPIDAPHGGLQAGFIHPWLGLDHMLAMVAVGLWAAQNGDRRARWIVPSAFAVMMAAGGGAGLAGLTLPFGEAAIAASLVLLGMFVVLAVRMPMVAGAAVAGLFAIVHGHAHGAEMPPSASPLLYGLGFMAATAALHASGIALGVLAREGRARTAMRAACAGIAGYGVFLMRSVV